MNSSLDYGCGKCNLEGEIGKHWLPNCTCKSDERKGIEYISSLNYYRDYFDLPTEKCLKNEVS